MLSQSLFVASVLCVIISVWSMECPSSCPPLMTTRGKSNCCSLGDGAPGCGICAFDTCAGNNFDSCEIAYGVKFSLPLPGCFIDANEVTPGNIRLGVVAGRFCPAVGSIVICSNVSGDCETADDEHMCAQYPLTVDIYEQSSGKFVYNADEVYDSPFSNGPATDDLAGTFFDGYEQDDMDRGDDSVVDDVYPVEEQGGDAGDDDAALADDELDPTPAADDGFESSLFVEDATTEDINLDTASVAADSPGAEAVADDVADTPTDATNIATASDFPPVESSRGHLRGSAHRQGLVSSVEDFFVLTASSALHSFLRSSEHAPA